MHVTHPIRLIVLGAVMILFGFCLSFAMVLRMVEVTFLLSFLAYIGSMMGLFLGIIGAVTYNGQRNSWD
ncbi:MAG: hypothetical protein AAF702_34020 [Chloroflexota bacterium]